MMRQGTHVFPLIVLLVACSTSSSRETSTHDAGDGSSQRPTDAAAGPDARSHVDAEGAPDAAHETDASSVYGPYGAAGPATVTTAELTVTPPSGQPFTVTAYVPGTSGLHPVVVLSSGFFQKALAYAPYGERLASWGVVAILRDNPGVNEAAAGIASDVGYVVSTWLGAQNADSTSPLDGRVDVTRIGLAGHSEGGQVSLLAAEGGALGKVKGVFGLDPVDSASDGGPEARGSIATIGVPIAFIGETTDGTGGVDGMPCAPAADDYEVLYADAASPIVAITAVHADHTMFEDPTHCTLCTLCTAGTANAADVLAFSVRYLTAFFARELLGDTHVGAAFQGAGSAADVSAGLTTVQSK
jgi:dienelactone hydrolase